MAARDARSAKIAATPSNLGAVSEDKAGGTAEEVPVEAIAEAKEAEAEEAGEAKDEALGEPPKAEEPVKIETEKEKRDRIAMEEFKAFQAKQQPFVMSNEAKVPPPATFAGGARRQSSAMPGAVVNPMLGQCLDSSSPPITLFDGFKQTVKEFRDEPALLWKDAHGEKYQQVCWEEYVRAKSRLSKSLRQRRANAAPTTLCTRRGQEERTSAGGEQKRWAALLPPPLHHSPQPSPRRYYNNAINFGRALLAHKVQMHSSVNILGFNSPEWFYALMGCVAVGGIAAGIYTTNLPEAVSYIINHSDCEVICFDSDDQFKKVMQEAPKCPNLRVAVQWFKTEQINPQTNKVWESGDLIDERVK